MWNVSTEAIRFALHTSQFNYVWFDTAGSYIILDQYCLAISRLVWLNFYAPTESSKSNSDLCGQTTRFLCLSKFLGVFNSIFVNAFTAAQLLRLSWLLSVVEIWKSLAAKLIFNRPSSQIIGRNSGKVKYFLNIKLHPLEQILQQVLPQPRGGKNQTIIF